MEGILYAIKDAYPEMDSSLLQAYITDIFEEEEIFED